MTPNHKQFDAALVAAAEDTLSGITSKQRAHFALKLILDIDDPDLEATILFVGRRVQDHAADLGRKADSHDPDLRRIQFEAECG